MFSLMNNKSYIKRNSTEVHFYFSLPVDVWRRIENEVSLGGGLNISALDEIDVAYSVTTQNRSSSHYADIFWQWNDLI